MPKKKISKPKVFIKERKLARFNRFIVGVKKGSKSIPIAGYSKRKDAQAKMKRLKKTGLVK